MKFKLLFLCLISSIVAVKLKAKGESCIESNTRRPGICKTKSACKVLKMNLSVCNSTLMTICCPNSHQTISREIPRKGISYQKCREYGTFYNKTETMTNSQNTKFNKTISTCKSVVTPLVYGGKKAIEKEFPHMALIGYGQVLKSVRYRCGGSLISDQWVLTAAHCIITSEGAPTFVKLGSLQRRDENDESKFKIFSVIEIESHPEYNKTHKFNDIALLKLHQVVVFTDYIVPICLPVSRNVDIFATAAGWGKSENEEAPEYLLKVKLEIFPRDECTTHYPKRLKKLPDDNVDDKVICAGHRFDRKDTCRGDSGGPLQVDRTNMPCMFTLIGSTAYGYNNCATIGVPAVYVRTYNYLDWIEEIVWPDAVETRPNED